MASMEPSEHDISSVVDFTGLNPFDDRAMIIRALKNNNYDVQTVVGLFYDSSESFRRKYGVLWDDSVFAADRDGTDNNAGISFHIESPNQNDVIQGVTPPPEQYGLGAPSRPPSRSNNRSPLGMVVDWTAADAPGVPNSQAQEDEDMRRALRESAQEAGITMPPHETGITDNSASQPYFGPANRDDYEEGNWAMVPVSGPETRLSSAPPASLRKRTAGAPAFLVQGNSTVGDHCLGGLLTILHEIPLARNALLECGSPAASYGHNSEWWKGQEILPPHVLAQLQSGELQWGEQDEAKPDLDEELHRLMAFLDGTERSYGTVSVITDLIPRSKLGTEKTFYEQLEKNNKDKIGPLTQVACIAYAHDDSPPFEDAEFGLLEIEHLRSDYGVIKTLYESLDHLMWSDVLSWNELTEGSKMAMFKKMGDVFVIKVGGDGPEDSIDIPTELYPEKYLLGRKEEARRIQLSWCETKRAIVEIAEKQQELCQWRDQWNSNVHDRRNVLNTAMEQWKEYGEYLDGLARFRAMESSGFDTNKYPEYHAAPLEVSTDDFKYFSKVEEVIRYVDEALKSVRQRLRDLEAQLEQVKAKQRFLGRLLTVPDKAGRPRPMSCNKYLLRGVATSTDVVYVCQHVEKDLIDLGDAPKQTDQWWRLAYVPSEEEPVKAERVEIERVLRDMWRETKKPLLVYATEAALSTPRAALSSALERFVKAENKAFRQELNQERADARERRPGPVDPISPSKRKHRADSFGSMDTNRVSIGSDGRNGFDNPFEDQTEGAGVELTNMDRSAHVSEYLRSMEEALPPTDVPPALPSRKRASTSNTSATVTPGTMTAEERDLDRGQSGSEGAKSPEMQERARPPSIMGLPRNPSGQKQSITMMDMEIPEHQE